MSLRGAHVALLATAMLVCAGPAHALLPIERWETSSGARVYFVHSDNLPIVDVSVQFPAGSGRDTLARSGLAGLDAGVAASRHGDSGRRRSFTPSRRCRRKPRPDFRLRPRRPVAALAQRRGESRACSGGDGRHPAGAELSRGRPGAGEGAGGGGIAGERREARGDRQPYIRTVGVPGSSLRIAGKRRERVGDASHAWRPGPVPCALLQPPGRGRGDHWSCFP